MPEYLYIPQSPGCPCGSCKFYWYVPARCFGPSNEMASWEPPDAGCGNEDKCDGYNHCQGEDSFPGFEPAPEEWGDVPDDPDPIEIGAGPYGEPILGDPRVFK